MGPQPTITNVLFDAFLKCKMKADLLAGGAEETDTDIPRHQHGLAKTYEQSALQHLRSRVSDGQVYEGAPPLRDLQLGLYRLIINPVIVVPGLRAELHALERVTVGRVPAQYALCPVRFVPNSKLTRLDKLAVAFDALALSHLAGGPPLIAKIVHGRDYTSTIVRMPKLVEEVRSLVAELTAQQASGAPPPLILNKHCPACEFQTRCRQVATEKDDLSLVATINEKERAKQNAKGIFTVTQLSYTYRPRRRSAHSSALTPKHEPALKALAIRKQCVHIVGTPRFTIPASAVYLDVEGVPDQDFYYLLGLRYRRGDADVHDAFWADDPRGEREMWAACLKTLMLIRDPVLVHYGSYETQFLKHMKAHYHEACGDGEFMNRLIAASVNVLSPLYAQVYFPTYSNSLKDIARHLGFSWSEANASGLHALMWRSEWETSHEPSIKQKLITYNAEDCEAAQRVAEAIAAICSEQPITGPQARSVSVNSLEHDYPCQFRALAYAIPEFKPINEAAYWDYQRSRVYTRSNRRLKSVASHKNSKRHKRIKPPGVHIAPVRPECCSRCGWQRVYVHRIRSKLVYDLKFHSTGIRRSTAKFFFTEYRCPACGTLSRGPVPDRFGRNLRAYIVYQIVELHMSLRSISRGLDTLFGISLPYDTIAHIKSMSAVEYSELYERILQSVVEGSAVHADETRVTVDEKLGYVWVFTNVESVAYVYSDTRDASTPKMVLRSFAGVLISDFYSAYDCIDTAQQKCLIHLLRDINDDVLRHPFNDEMEQVARSFAGLIKPMIETIDRFGLKAWHLRKHKKAVESFFRQLARRRYQTEVARGYQKRFEKNQERLFTFLDYDDVPWNNNNAEHAIKSFARMRNVIGANSTNKSIQDSLALLSISETCKYKDVNFLRFLRSGDVDIDLFAARRCARYV